MPTQLVEDGTVNFSGGQNAALDPDLIAENQYFIGVNVSAEIGSLKPRWAYIHLDDLDFSKAGQYTRKSGFKVDFEEVFLDGRFQALIPYSIGPDFYNIYIVSGFIFLINLQTFVVTVMNPTDPVNVNERRINWSSAGPYLVIFDFPNVPFIIDGITIRRSDPAGKDEIPVSVLGTHNQNRLAIANAGITWTAGDPAGNPATPFAPITFTEVYLNSSPFKGDLYEIPTANQNNDNITAMGYLQVLDKSTQIGSLLVATQHSITSYPTFLPRDAWQANSTNPTNVFGSLLLSVGVAGQRSQVNVNSDYLFLSPEGLIYAVTMARDDQYRWSNSPISREVKNFLIYPDPSLVGVSVASRFKNKIFFSCYPYRVACSSAEGTPQYDVVNGGIVVIETDNMATLGNKSPPAWAGAWTGVPVMDMVENNGKMYVAGKQDGRNALFILSPDQTYDVINKKVRFIESTIITKEYGFKNQTINKELHSLDLGLRDIKEQLKYTVEYKSDVLQDYVFWQSGQYTAPVMQCQGFPEFPNGLQAQGIRDLNIGEPSGRDCNPAMGEQLRWLKSMQVRITLSAMDWTLKYVKVKAVPQPQSDNRPFCNTNPGVPVPSKCFNIWKIPEAPCPQNQ